jgi:hypothetical protein
MNRQGVDESAQSIDFNLSASGFDNSFFVGGDATRNSNMMGGTGRTRDQNATNANSGQPSLKEVQEFDGDELSGNDMELSESNFSTSFLLQSGNIGKNVTNPPFKGSVNRERAFTAVNKKEPSIKGTTERIQEELDEDFVDDSNEKKEKYTK